MGQGFPRDGITEKLQKGGGEGNRERDEEARTRNEAEQIEMERRDFYPQLCKSLVPGSSSYSSLIMLSEKKKKTKKKKQQAGTRGTTKTNDTHTGTVSPLFKVR